MPKRPQGPQMLPNPSSPNQKWVGLVQPNFGQCAAWGPASGTALGLWVAAAKPEAVARPQGTTPGLAAKTGRMLARVPKGRAVDSEAARVAWVPPPQASRPGPEAGAWAGAGAPRFPVWTELSKALALSRRPVVGGPDTVCGVAPGFKGSLRAEVGLQKQCRQAGGPVACTLDCHWKSLQTGRNPGGGGSPREESLGRWVVSMVANSASEEPGLRVCWLTCGPEEEGIDQLAEGGVLGTATGAWLCEETGHTYTIQTWGWGTPLWRCGEQQGGGEERRGGRKGE